MFECLFLLLFVLLLLLHPLRLTLLQLPPHPQQTLLQPLILLGETHHLALQLSTLLPCLVDHEGTDGLLTGLYAQDGLGLGLQQLGALLLGLRLQQVEVLNVVQRDLLLGWGAGRFAGVRLRGHSGRDTGGRILLLVPDGLGETTSGGGPVHRLVDFPLFLLVAWFGGRLGLGLTFGGGPHHG